MRIALADYIRATVEWAQIKQAYTSMLKDFISKAKAMGINRDGDIYQVSCPVCKSKKVFQACGGTFVCSRKHVFSVYTEDGVQEITDETRVDGDDLQKDGKDAHGHATYLIHKPDEKTAVFLTYWFEAPAVTPEMVSNEVWKLRATNPLVDSLWFDYMIEIDTMLGGEQVASISSRIKTWPKYINNMKWFLLMMQLKPLQTWKLGFLEYSDV